MLDFALLDGPVSRGVVWLAILVPVVQGVLVQYRGTKLIRLALVPLACTLASSLHLLVMSK